MKCYLIPILLGASLISVSSYFSQEIKFDTLNTEIFVSEIDTTFAIPEPDYQIDNYLIFTERLGFRESSNRYHITSRSGTFKGRYQFGPAALYDIDMAHISRNEFLRNPYYQEIALIRYLKINEYYLEYYIDKYEGKEINEIKISRAGILAAAHLVGHRWVRTFFDSNGKVVRRDGNGVPLTEYLELFSDIKLNLNFNEEIVILLFDKEQQFNNLNLTYSQ